MNKIIITLIFLIFLSGCQTETLSPESLLESSGKNLSYLVELCKNYNIDVTEIEGDFTVSCRIIYQDSNNAILAAVPESVNMPAVNRGLFIFLEHGSSDWIITDSLWIHERYDLEYSVVNPPLGTDAPAWFCINRETNHGTGVNVYHQFWYTPDGREVLSFPIYKDLIPTGDYDKNHYAVEFTAETSFKNLSEDKNSILLLIKYTINVYSSRAISENERIPIKQFNEITGFEWDSVKEKFIFNEEESSINFEDPKLNFMEMSEFLETLK